VPPRVTWFQPTALYLVAAILGYVARATHTALQQRRGGLRPHEAVNRLVLARACAIVGALVTGGYLGYAFTWVGLRAELAGERIVPSLVAAVGALLTTGAALLLERACRVRGDDEES
jgi:ABC-type sulfate transport system permease component